MKRSSGTMSGKNFGGGSSSSSAARFASALRGYPRSLRRTRRPEEWQEEPDLTQVLRDPVVVALMNADRVDPRALKAALAKLASDIRRS